MPARLVGAHGARILDGVLFAVGSLLFAPGALPGYAGAVGVRWVSETFFAGSLFFTSAGFLTYREAVDAVAPAGSHRRFFVFQPGGSTGGRRRCSSLGRSSSM